MDLAFGAYKSITGVLSGPAGMHLNHTLSSSIQNYKVAIFILSIS